MRRVPASLKSEFVAFLSGGEAGARCKDYTGSKVAKRRLSANAYLPQDPTPIRSYRLASLSRKPVTAKRRRRGLREGAVPGQGLGIVGVVSGRLS